MKKRVLFEFVSLTVILMMACSLCWGEAKYGGSLVYGIEGDIKGLDPHKGMSGVEAQVVGMMCELLVAPDKNVVPQPALAESWEVSADLKEWVFHLRKGVKFHNGRELTAEDVKFNYDRLIKKETGSPQRANFEAQVEALEIIDPYTVKFKLKGPSGSFLSYLYSAGTATFYILARESVNEDGAVTRPIGTGPFELVEWKPNEHIKFKKFKDYRIEGLPYLDEVRMIPVPDVTVRMTALRSGDLDITRMLPLNELAKLQKRPPRGCHIGAEPGAISWWIGFNQHRPPFDDVRVRRAVAYAINKDEMVLGLSHGTGEAINQPFPKGSRWYMDVPDYTQDLEKARQLMKEAGYPEGVDVTLVTSNSYREMVMMAEIMQAQLKEIGINITLDIGDWASTLKKWKNSKDWIIQVSGWSRLVDPEAIYPRLYMPGGLVETRFAYKNPQLQEVIKQGPMATDLVKRKDTYKKAVGIMQDELPIIWAVGTPRVFGWRDHVKGFEPNLPLMVYSGNGLHYTWLDK